MQCRRWTPATIHRANQYGILNSYIGSGRAITRSALETHQHLAQLIHERVKFGRGRSSLHDCKQIFGSSVTSEIMCTDKNGVFYYGNITENNNGLIYFTYCVETSMLTIQFAFKLYHKVGENIIFI